MNYSDLSRRDQVLARLREADGGWVDGAQLATAECGGSEGLKRLRELRSMYGHDIRKRQKANSDQFQYRLAGENVYPPETPQASQPSQPTISDAIHEAREPAETYEYKREPAPQAKARLGKTLDGKFVMVRDEPPPGQITAFDNIDVAASRFTSMPTILELGRTIPCPRCKGWRRTIKERDPITNKQIKGGKVIGYEDQTRDPHKPSETCPRCSGFGVVPNE